MKLKRIKTINDKVLYCSEKIQNLTENAILKLKNLIEINPELTLNQIIKLYKKGWGPYNRCCKEYWLNRGWNEIDSYIKGSRDPARLFGRLSPFSHKFWINKINPKTNDYYSLEESQFEANKRRPIKKEYWLVKGYTEEESKQLAYKTKCSNNKKGGICSKNINKNIKKSVSKRCIEYWLSIGYNFQQAIEKVSEVQSTFSLKKCIETYGAFEGHKKWKERQEKWQNTLKNKSEDDIFNMLIKKNQGKKCYSIYIVKYIKNNKEYIKIGKTNKSLHERFKHEQIIPIEIYDFCDYNIVNNIEEYVMKTYKTYIQKDFFDVSGYTEIFYNNLPLNDIKQYIENKINEM